MENLVNKPWGTYQVIYQIANKFKVKILTVFAGERLSFQSHEYRKEIWTCISGEGIVWINNYSSRFLPEQSFKIERNEVHCLSNSSSSKTLIVLELQMGEILVEEDIKRYGDKYGRK